MMRILLAALSLMLPAWISIHSATANGADSPQPVPCALDTGSGTRSGLEGVIVDGHCVGRSAGGIPVEPKATYRTLNCLADGTAIVHGGQLLVSGCDDGMPKCQLLTEGGQSSPNPILAYEDQILTPGQTQWQPLAFWCPQSTAPVSAGPDVAAIRDRVIRLLPRVPAVTTGPNTLVNIQTLLWADTSERRSLGRVSVVGQRVWLQIAFDHAVWNFGDGSSTSSDVPGKVYDATGDPCRTVSCPDYFGHTFTETGVMTVSVQIAWRASYSLDGQHYQPVEDAPITGPAGTVQIHVREARGVLVTTGD